MPDPLEFAEFALSEASSRVPDLDTDAMHLVLSLHRIINLMIYDLESTVHRPHGWSWAGFRVLFILWVCGPSEGNQIAARTGMSRAAVSYIANTLERDGMVQKEASPSDGRAVVLSLTPSGQKRFTKAFAGQNRREQQWSSLLDDNERKQLLALMDKLTARSNASWVNRRP